MLLTKSYCDAAICDEDRFPFLTLYPRRPLIEEMVTLMSLQSIAYSRSQLVKYIK